MKKKWLLLLILLSACHIGELFSPDEVEKAPTIRVKICWGPPDTIPVVLHHADSTFFVFDNCRIY